ncbi:MAG: hypothetical protein HKM87_09160 [Ignavibacteriaceae bacterium]|nr:hypothetical protein [Ignavibacteriaceae bacterium]
MFWLVYTYLLIVNNAIFRFGKLIWLGEIKYEFLNAMFIDKHQMRRLRIFSVIFLAAWCLFMFINYIIIADDIEPVAVVVLIACVVLLLILLLYVK